MQIVVSGIPVKIIKKNIKNMQRQILNELTCSYPAASGVLIFTIVHFGTMVRFLKKGFQRMIFTLKILRQSGKKCWSDSAFRRAQS